MCLPLTHFNAFFCSYVCVCSFSFIGVCISLRTLNLLHVVYVSCGCSLMCLLLCVSDNRRFFIRNGMKEAAEDLKESGGRRSQSQDYQQESNTSQQMHIQKFREHTLFAHCKHG